MSTKERKRDYEQTKFEKFKARIKGALYDVGVKLAPKNKKPSSTHKRKLREKAFYWSVVILPLIHFLLFYVYVNINSILLAFKQYTVDASGYSSFTWVGFDNFKLILSEFIYGNKLKQIGLNSLIVYFVNLFAGVPLSLLFSYYLFKKGKFTGFFRVMLYLPSIISSIVTVTMYKFLVDRGIMQVASLMGKEIMPPMSNNSLMLPFVIFYNVLVGFGTSTVMYSSAMSRIDESLFEYASLDGVSPSREFFSIVLPLIYPTIVTFLVVGVAGIFINQANLFTFYSSEASANVQTFGYYMFVMVSRSTNVEYPTAAAYGLLFTVIAAPLTLLVKRLLDRFDPQVEY